MILRHALLFAAVVSGATLYPVMQRQGWFDSPTAKAEKPAQITVAKVETAPPAQLGRTVRISNVTLYPYLPTTPINGELIEVLIDTGASVIAINRTTARRLGVAVTSADFTRTVNTANGTIKAAPVTLSRVEIGRIQARDVAAVVLDDAALSGALIGMSFLKSMRFSVEDNTFVLSQ